MDRILFGDNQFFGVNHMSEEKARAQAMRFKDTQAIMQVLESAYDLGIVTFMCTTHDRVGEIADLIRARPERYPGFEFYPCMPYAHKYANSVGEVGMLETLKRFAPGGVIETLVKGAFSAATKDLPALMRLLVDAEMKRFEGLRTPVVFVQNVVTDLLLGLKLYPVLAEFHRYIRERYGAEAGFITMNVPALLDALESVGVENPIVCANINKIGFRMSGGLPAYEEAIARRRFRPIAMSVFASGAIPAAEALDYVCRQPRIEAIVFGASSRGNIEGTKRLVEQLDAKYARPAAVSA
jgi:hypothetical protein